MERRYYSVDSLVDIVNSFEEEYGMPSRDLLERHRSGEEIEGLPNYERHAWLSFHRELSELRGARFASDVRATVAAV